MLHDLHILPKTCDSWSYIYIEHARIEQEHMAIAVFAANGKTPIPCATISLLMLGPAAWDNVPRESRPQFRTRAAERRLTEAFGQLQEAEWRQESAGRLAWYEAQYEHELATYTHLCAQPAGSIGPEEFG